MTREQQKREHMAWLRNNRPAMWQAMKNKKPKNEIMTAKQILELIESVDPKDTEKLDEIDSLVEEYIGLERMAFDVNGNPCTLKEQKAFLQKRGINPSFPFTRSRDALKAIRPNGWVPKNVQCTSTQAQFQLFYTDGGQGCYFDSKCWTVPLFLPTEELAELHAIIQAIEWERSHETLD